MKPENAGYTYCILRIQYKHTVFPITAHGMQWAYNYALNALSLLQWLHNDQIVILINIWFILQP